MKRVIILALLVAGGNLMLSAQNGNRATIPAHLWTLKAPQSSVMVENIGPLINPPYLPIPWVMDVVIDPLLYNLSAKKSPVRQEYRPYNPLRRVQDVAEPMPRTRER